MLPIKEKERGIIVTYVLVFGSVFLMLLSGLLGVILIQLRQASQRVAWNEALDIAEAAAGYYRWCLNNGVEANCAGERDYVDGEGNPAGRFSIAESSTLYCGLAVQHRITATGGTTEFPQVKRAVEVLYARESIAKYSYVVKSSVWIGNDHQIRGPYHGNGGIRMDGQNESLITSAVLRDGVGEWVCTSSFGCSPCPTGAGRCRYSSGQCICPGVFTTTSNPTTSLFQFPVPPFDFNAITIDLAQIKDKADNGGGIYLLPSLTIDNDGKGYHLKFLADGTVQAWIITALTATEGYSTEDGWQDDNFTIASEYLYDTYTIPSSCSAIYVEDNLWPEGVIKGKVVLASANLIGADVNTDIVLAKNITYSASDGSDGLLLIGERNVLIGPQSPDDMDLHGIIVAQTGRFSRNHYPNNFRDSLSIFGSVVSSGRVGTKWTSGGSIVSGYLARETYFDQNLVYNPPPFAAHLDPEYKIVSWREIE